MGSSNQWRIGHHFPTLILDPWIAHSCVELGAGSLNKDTHLHREQSPQEAIQLHEDQRRLEIPLLDFLVLFEVSMEILSSVLKRLLEEVQRVHDHSQFPLTFFHLTSQEAFWAEIIRGLECKQIFVAKPASVQDTLVFVCLSTLICVTAQAVLSRRILKETSDPILRSMGGLGPRLKQNHPRLARGQAGAQRSHGELLSSQLGPGKVLSPSGTLL